MRAMERAERSRLRQRTTTFRTSTLWTGEHTGMLSGEGKQPLTVASPEDFSAEPGMWTPEDMFVAAVEVCHMATFLSYAEKEGVPIASYRSHANGVLEYVDGDYRFTRIVIFPTITVSSAAVESQVHEILREAQKHCLVANSIASIVEVNPTIMVQ